MAGNGPAIAHDETREEHRMTSPTPTRSELHDQAREQLQGLTTGMQELVHLVDEFLSLDAELDQSAGS